MGGDLRSRTDRRQHFAIQSEVAAAIAGALEGHAHAGEKAGSRVPTQNLEAWEAYQLGKQRMARRTSARWTRPRNSFAKRSTSIPISRWRSGSGGRVQVADRLQRQAEVPRSPKPRLDEALALDPNLAEAWTSQRNRDKPAAIRSCVERYRRAIELAPTTPPPITGSADCCSSSAAPISRYSMPRRPWNSIRSLPSSTRSWLASWPGSADSRNPSAHPARHRDRSLDTECLHEPRQSAGLRIQSSLPEAVPLIDEAIASRSKQSSHSGRARRMYVDLGEDAKSRRAARVHARALAGQRVVQRSRCGNPCRYMQR